MAENGDAGGPRPVEPMPTPSSHRTSARLLRTPDRSTRRAGHRVLQCAMGSTPRWTRRGAPPVSKPPSAKAAVNAEPDSLAMGRTAVEHAVGAQPVAKRKCLDSSPAEAALATSRCGDDLKG